MCDAVQVHCDDTQPVQKAELNDGMEAVNVWIIPSVFVTDSYGTAEGLTLSVRCKRNNGFSYVGRISCNA